jgi:peptidoglycan/LPS O-acetylase OafA/YrhL
LTGLRGVAASSVVFYHVWLYGAPGAHSFPSGQLARVFTNLEFGVAFFFALSGLLLYRPYARALLAGSDLPRLRHFAVARVLRIVPAYWTILLVVVALTERHMFHQPWVLLANMAFLEFWIPGFFPTDLGSANGSMAIVPSWSLGVEAAFYISLPVLAGAAFWVARRTGRRIFAAFLPAIVLTVVGGAGVAVEQLLSGNMRRAWAAGFPLHAGWFACGMAGATLAFLIEERRLRLPAYWRAGSGIVALALTLASIKLHNLGAFSKEDYQWPFAASISLFLVLVVIAEDGSPLRTVLGSRILVLMGLASYSVFLVHDPIIRQLRTQSFVSSGVEGFLLELLLVGVATAVAATISYQVLERPCFALKRRLTSPASGHAVTAARPPLRVAFHRPSISRPSGRTVSAALEQLVADVDPSRTAGFTIETSRDTRLWVDPEALAPIVLPLLRNALAYGEAPIVLRASRVDGRLQLAVEDSGRGVDEHFIPRLFDSFTRSEPSSCVPGAGLGLAHARRSARALGGEIVYLSGRPTGAHFAITLPLEPLRPRSVSPRWARRVRNAARRTSSLSLTAA